MQLDSRLIFRFAVIGVACYLGWSALSPSSPWKDSEASNSPWPAVRASEMPEDLELDTVADPFPWPLEKAKKSSGGQSEKTRLNSLTALIAAGGEIAVDGVFVSPAGRKVLIAGAWIGEGETLEGLAVVHIGEQAVTLRAGDQDLVAPLSTTPIELY